MKIKVLIMALVMILTFSLFCGAVYADGDNDPGVEETVSEVTVTEDNSFTPPGSASVIDYAADSDGKLFYTITTPAENVFYLVIDRQRETENVYFLNAVTEEDLIPLAGTPETPEPSPVLDPEPKSDPEPVVTPEPEKETGGSGFGILMLVILAVGGGAVWYLKVYRPANQRKSAAGEDEYDPYAGDRDDDNTDSVPWDDGGGDEDSEGTRYE